MNFCWRRILRYDCSCATRLSSIWTKYLGQIGATIPVYGRDELGRIAGLLRHTLGQLNAQKQQLEQEIGERKAIEADLRATQDELIQTAKLAVVGQTMTTLAHEINQPLNALSMYQTLSQNEEVWSE